MANFLEIIRQTLLRLSRSRLIYLVILACCGAAVLGGFVSWRTAGEFSGSSVLGNLGFWLGLQLFLPWMTVFFAVQAVHGDIEDRTFQYLQFRPVRRSTILLCKVLAVWMWTLLLMIAFYAALFAGMVLPGWDWSAPPRFHELLVLIGGAAIGCAGYAAVGALFASWFRRPLVWGVFYILGLETVAANLPRQAEVHLLTVLHPVRCWTLLGFEVSPGSRLGRNLWPAEDDWTVADLGDPLQRALLLTAIVLLLALWIFGRSEYDSRAAE